jgi:hypothetical protein
VPVAEDRPSQHPNLARQYLLRVDDGGWEKIGEISQGGGKWAAYTKFRETPNLFMIYRGARTFSMIPKRAFTVSQLGEFRELISNKLPGK